MLLILLETMVFDRIDLDKVEIENDIYTTLSLHIYIGTGIKD